MNFVDLSLNKNDGTYYDLSFSNGDFLKIAGFDTSLQLSFMCEKRATESQVKEPQFRRGWWGNEINNFDDFEYGSLLWLLSQARATQDTLNNAINYTRDCLRWMIEDNHVDTIRVTGEYDKERHLILNIDFVRNNNVIFSISYNLWENTFIDGDF